MSSAWWTRCAAKEKIKTEVKGPLTTLGALQILFLFLKLTHQIDWSWWWVMTPALFNAFMVLVGRFLDWGADALEEKTAKMEMEMSELDRHKRSLKDE